LNGGQQEGGCPYCSLFKTSIMRTIVNRLQQDTPPFFRTLRNVGLCLAAAGATIIAAPVALPTIVVSIANYLIVAGSVASAISQATVMQEVE
jgi:hypothetical protein